MRSPRRPRSDGRTARALARAGLLCALLAAAGVQADPLLDAARWQHRLLVIAAPAGDDDLLRQQRELLAGLEAEAASRELLVVEIVGAAVEVRPATALPSADAGALRGALSLDERPFGLVLVGLDGGVKLRSDRPLPACALLGAIDAMPMRRGALGEGGAIRCPD